MVENQSLKTKLSLDIFISLKKKKFVSYFNSPHYSLCLYLTVLNISKVGNYFYAMIAKNLNL